MRGETNMLKSPEIQLCNKRYSKTYPPVHDDLKPGCVTPVYDSKESYISHLELY